MHYLRICSTTVVPVLRVGEFETKVDILEKTNGIQFQGGNTNTAEALSYIRQKGFKATESKDRPKIAIILTDGQSNDVVRTITEAAKTKTDGITVFVIGIGSQVSVYFRYTYTGMQEVNTKRKMLYDCQ